MTTNTLHGKSKDGLLPADHGLAIGETGVRLFDCPSCTRPLAIGTARCPGCGARLVMGVTLGRVGGILAIGTVFGLLVAGAVMSVGANLAR